MKVNTHSNHFLLYWRVETKYCIPRELSWLYNESYMKEVQQKSCHVVIEVVKEHSKPLPIQITSSYIDTWRGSIASLGFNHDLKCCRLLEEADTIFYVESWLADLSTNFLEYHWNIGIYRFFFTNFLVNQRPVNALSPSTNSGQRVSSPFKFHVVGVGGIGEPMPKGLGSSLVIIGLSFHSFNICW